MKRRTDQPSDDDDSPTAAVGTSSSATDGNTDEPAKKLRTEPAPALSEPEASSSQLAQLDPQEADPVTVPDLGEDLVFEVLRRAEARTLAAAACVSRRWRQLAEDERLWEAACVREWASLGCSEQQLRAVVLSLGGFRHLHAVYLRPLHRRGAGPPQWGRRPPAVRLGRDQVQLSLSLLSIGFFQKMSTPTFPNKDKKNDDDKNGGCR